jgi:hypothetical protein
MGNDQDRLRLRSRAGRSGTVMLLAIVLGAALILAAPAFAHYSGSDVTQCFGCHSTEFGQWSTGAPYPSADGLTGHNVTMAQTLTNTGHNSSEQVTGECISCHSPFSAKHQSQAAWTKIGELVAPLNLVGSPKGTWTLKAPYKSAVGGSTPVAGFFFPAQHATQTTLAAWEGISCRVCHDDSNANNNPTLGFFKGLPPFAAGVAGSYKYVNVKNATALCESCHQPASDDSRTASSESVHAGIPCTTCHMTDASGQPTHTLSAGKLGAALATTACNQCHAAAGNPAGHPGVTTLDTSFQSQASLEKYGADPMNLKFSADARRNIHFVTCDSCHPANAAATTATAFVYSSTPKKASFTASGNVHAGQFAPATADDASRVFVWTKASAAAGSTYKPAATSLASAGGTYTSAGLTQNTNFYFTQATASRSAFPGLGRGTLITVLVKVKATLKASAARIKHGKSVTLTAMLAPTKAGKKVVIQRSRNGKSWATWKSVKMTSRSSVQVAWKAPSAKGKYYFRVSYKGDAANAANVSAARKIVVK